MSRSIIRSPLRTPGAWRTPSTSTISTAALSDSSENVGSDSSTATHDHQEDSVAVGLSDPSNTGNQRAMLQLKLINRLHDTGVQTDIDLPMIAVIGNQSAGKSSLIESISGITLPRSSGTCTRCPTECKLSRSDSPWKCVVKLHFSTDARGVPIPVKIVPFGGPITAKDLVEDRIRRAQRAILNPSTNPTNYLQQIDLSDESEVSFSKNYVSLEISGPELTDLSFVDLPGLIASVGRGSDDRDIELVKSLVTCYIEKPSCVILLTVACETDFENQGAHNLAKRYDPDGKRTVGVLTKPDRIPPGDEHAWLRILRNETEPLVNNWYCVKQPSSQDVAKGITWKAARKQEDEWFSSEQPWCSLEPQYQRFLRTSFLIERLGLILSELIAKRLPKIQEELLNAIQETEKRFRALPKAPSEDPLGEVHNTLRGFVRDLERRVEGTPNKDGLLQTIRPHQEAFKVAIRKTAPIFVTSGKETKETKNETLYMVEVPAAPPSPTLKPAFLANEDGNDSPDEEQFDSNQKIHIDDVLQRAQEARTRELPDNYPFVVQRGYIREITEKWSGPAMVLFDHACEILRADLAKLVEDHFEHIGNGNARQAILMIVNDHLDEAAVTAKERIQWLLDLEANPTTLNVHYFSDYKDKFLGHYKACRGDREVLNKLQQGYGHDKTVVNRALATINEIGISAKATDLAKLLPSDPLEPALNIAASVRAYFQVAYKRFVDMVAMAVDHEIVLGVQNGIYKALQEGLEINGPEGYDRCKSMLEEPIRIASAREEIQKRMQRLQAARLELRRMM